MGTDRINQTDKVCNAKKLAGLDVKLRERRKHCPNNLNVHP